MEKVIDITERLKERGRPQDEDIKRLEAIKRIVTCAFCLYRCGMCGAKIQEGNYIDKVNLCKACYMEYLDYLELKKEEASLRRKPWQDSNWERVWRQWESFREALLSYRDSLEYF